MFRKDRSERPPKRRRWGLRLLVLLLALGALGWFMPALVAGTSLRQRIVSLAVPKLRGTATIGGATLGWLKPVELRDVEVRDEAGAQLVMIPLVTTSRPLWQLALKGKDLGVIRIERPEVNLVVCRGGSNLEDAIQPILDEPASGGAPRSMEIEIVDGKIALAEASEQEQPAAESAGTKNVASRAVPAGTIDKFNLKLTLAPGQPEPLSATLDCIVTSANGAAGKSLTGTVALKPHDDAAPSAADQAAAALKLSAVELSALTPVLTRFAVPLQLAGAATTDLKLNWTTGEHGPKVDVQGTASVERLAMTSPEYLGPETLRLEQLRIKPDVAYGGGRLKLKSTRADCDMGFLEASGAIDVASWSAVADIEKSLANLAATDFMLQGELDCAMLAQRLPRLVRLKPGTQIEGGRLSVALQSGGPAEKRRLEGSVKAASVRATAAGRRIEYLHPIEIDGSLDLPASGAWIARLKCKSDYLTADAEGSLLDASLSLEADLDRLSTDVGQIVDLGQVRAAGRVAASFEVRRKRAAAGAAAGPSLVTGDGRMLLENFQLQVPGLRPWQEPRLASSLSLRGTAEGTTLTRLESAELRVDSGADHLLTKLTRPIDKPTFAGPWPMSASVEGDVAAWLARVQPWLPLEGWQLAGTARGTAEATLSATRCDAQQVHIALTGFKASSATMNIDEPQVQLEGSLEWDGAAQRVSVPTMTLQTSSVAMRADKLLWQLDPAARRAGGHVALRGDLARLSRWWEVPGKTPPFRLAGTVLGRVELSEAAGVLKADATAEADDFVAYTSSAAPVRTAGPAAVPAAASSAWQPVWKEPKIGFSGGVGYRAAGDQLDIDSVAVNSNALRLEKLRGSIQELTARRLVELSGEVHYDLEKITPLLAPYLGPGVRLAGQGHRTFALSGPLSNPQVTTALVPPELEGHAGVGFERADVYGLITGPGEIKAELKKQIVQFAPLQLAINQGKFAAAPRIELMAAPLLVQEPGRVVEQLDLTPALCQTWLKYVAPLLADATRADGKFSLDLSQCRVPLSDTTKSDVAGTLAIHTARVRPGPVAEPIILVARQIEAIVQKKPLAAVGGLLGGAQGGGMPGGDVQLNVESQNIQFTVRNGRVTHSPLKLVVSNIEIRTSGSVGFDQTLDLIAEVPIQQQWITKEPALKGMSNQTIQIPIRGTLARPSLDKRALESLTRQVGAAAVGGALEGAVQKGLEGLLKPKK